MNRALGSTKYRAIWEMRDRVYYRGFIGEIRFEQHHGLLRAQWERRGKLSLYIQPPQQRTLKWAMDGPSVAFLKERFRGILEEAQSE